MNHILKALVPGILLFTTFVAHTMTKQSFSVNVDDKGKISLPKDFELELVHLGSWFVPEGDASGFHDVYTQVTSIYRFRV